MDQGIPAPSPRGGSRTLEQVEARAKLEAGLAVRDEDLHPADRPAKPEPAAPVDVIGAAADQA